MQFLAMQGIFSCFKHEPPTTGMSLKAGTSILEEALVCIGQRIATILIQPTDKDKNYIASLHNEVVGIFSEDFMESS